MQYTGKLRTIQLVNREGTIASPEIWEKSPLMTFIIYWNLLQTQHVVGVWRAEQPEEGSIG